MVGATESRLSQLFKQARLSAPTVLLLDQVRARPSNTSLPVITDIALPLSWCQVECIAPRRDAAGDGGGGSADRMLSTLLVELDGMMAGGSGGDGGGAAEAMLGHVFVVAATTHIGALDPALLRPG